MSSTWTLKPGVDIVYDGDTCTVAEICDGAVIVRTRTGQVRRLRMIDLLRPRTEGGTTHIRLFGHSVGGEARRVRFGG